MEPTWTEQLEAIATAVGAAAAIYAGYYAFKAYKKQNKDIQDQIDGLKTLAEHQAEENELLLEEIKINKKRRISEIAPILTFDLNGTMTVNGELVEQPYIKIKNEGEIARKIFIEGLSYAKSIKICEINEEYLDNFNSINVEIPDDMGHEQFVCDILYFDKDDNKYHRGFGFDYIEGAVYVKEARLNN